MLSISNLSDKKPWNSGRSADDWRVLYIKVSLHLEVELDLNCFFVDKGGVITPIPGCEAKSMKYGIPTFPHSNEGFK